MENICSRERFLKNVQQHEIEIMKDDGVYRHVICKRPGSGTYRFDLITIPGHLFVTGDMGCWTFSRTEDMFDFFIAGNNDFNKEHIINPHYWAKKVKSVSTISKIKEYSSDLLFNKVVIYFNRHTENFSKEKKEELWGEIKDNILDYINNHQQVIYRRINDFYFKGFEFINFFERDDDSEFTFHYIWVCYAIVWGILEYKKVKEKRKA